MLVLAQNIPPSVRSQIPLVGALIAILLLSFASSRVRCPQLRRNPPSARPDSWSSVTSPAGFSSMGKNKAS